MLKLKYFVLKPKAEASIDEYAIASRMAMKTYADYIEDFDGQLAYSLRTWAAIEQAEQSNLARKETEERHDGSATSDFKR